MRKALWAAVVLVGVLGIACVTVGVPQAGAAELFAKPATVSYQPATGTSEVRLLAPVSTSVVDGSFEKVELVGSDGTTAGGEFSEGRTRWTVTRPLHYGTTYTWRGTARGADDSATPLDGTFATITPERVIAAEINIADGRVVGVAAPVAIQFDGHVADRASVEKALTVTTSVPVEGSWGWLPDEPEGSRVHWRPRNYWPANTDVTVAATLLDVPFGDGAWGADNVTSTFRIGPAQIVKADVNSHRMIVMRDGAVVGDYPASYGLDTDPERNTRSGIHVVTEKFTDRRMVSQRYDYDVVVQWAVRMSNSGEFIHANPATTNVQGSRNVSHGCVNLSTADAKAYYDTARFGDPVEVTGSGVPLSARDGDIWDWTLSWEQWQNLSALDAR